MEGKLANPGPLGLTGFGLTTILLNIHNAGFYPVDAMIMGMGIFVGGIAQMIAGTQEFKKGNTFGSTAFTLYGAFWLSLVFIYIVKGAFPITEISMGFYLLVWGIFSTFMTIGTLKSNLAIRFVFITVTILFYLLAIGNFIGGHNIIINIAGYDGIICGASAVYLAVAEVLNEVYGKTILPIGSKK